MHWEGLRFELTVLFVSTLIDVFLLSRPAQILARYLEQSGIIFFATSRALRVVYHAF